jgi:integrase
VPRPQGDKPQPGLSLAKMIRAFLEYVYEREQGEKRSVFGTDYYALKPLAETHGAMPAASFGPKLLKQWQADMANRRLSRRYISTCISVIKTAFKWAASEELIPAEVYHALVTVSGLSPGKSNAKEPRKKLPVPMSYVLAIVPHVSANVAAMIQVQALTGCRSRSICMARPSQFTREGDLLLWRPRHKTERLAGEIVLPIGPRAQAVLLPFLADQTERFIFAPRATKNCRRYRDRYSSSSYREMVKRGIELLNKELAKTCTPALPHWSPHQLRHAKGHAVRAAYGIEAAQATLAHDNISTTQIYSASRLALAKLVARETG